MITETETVVKAHGSRWWETETMEVKTGRHRGQTTIFKHVELWQKHLLSLNTERLRHCVIDLQKPLVIVM